LKFTPRTIVVHIIIAILVVVVMTAVNMWCGTGTVVLSP
jgi:hypothetical protein